MGPVSYATFWIISIYGLIEINFVAFFSVIYVNESYICLIRNNEERPKGSFSFN